MVYMGKKERKKKERKKKKNDQFLSFFFFPFFCTKERPCFFDFETPQYIDTHAIPYYTGRQGFHTGA